VPRGRRKRKKRKHEITGIKIVKEGRKRNEGWKREYELESRLRRKG